MDYHPTGLLFSMLNIVPAISGVLIISTVLLFLVSFFMSGGRVAFFSLSDKDVNVLKTRSNPSYKRIVTLLEQPKILLKSILIANTFANLAIILILNTLLNEWLAAYALAIWFRFIIKIVIVSTLILAIGEVLPRAWAAQNKLRFAATSSLIIEVCNSIFSVFSKRFVALSERTEKTFTTTKNTADANEIDDDIDLLYDDNTSQEKKQILKGIRKFGDTTVKQIMKTRLDVFGIEEKTLFKNVVATVEDLHYSRLPVYKNNLDEIVGILNTKDLLAHLNKDETFDWKTLIRTPFFVHEQKPIEDLLQEFRKKQIHIAIVVDEFGGTSGLVTLEDIMEEIIGDIKDEFDDEVSSNKKIDENNYIFEGKLMINDACKMMNLRIDTFDAIRGESDSMAGLLLEIAGEFPQIEEALVSGDFKFIPLEISKNRIDKIKVIIKPKGL